MRAVRLAILLTWAAWSGFAAPAGADTVMSTGGRFYIEYDPSPTQIEINEFFDIRLRVRAGGPSGDLLCEVTILADLVMPVHAHGMNVTPKVVRQPDCSFSVQGMLMHMPGLWSLIVGVEQGGSAERAYANFDIWGGGD